MEPVLMDALPLSPIGDPAAHRPPSPEYPDVDCDHGLSSGQAADLLAEWGANRLDDGNPGRLRRLANSLSSPVAWMLQAAALLALAAGRWADSALILTLLLVNAGVSLVEQRHAGRALSRLGRRLAPMARVLRDGVWADRPADEVVPGDVIFLKLGRVVPADAVLLGEGALSIDASMLTGDRRVIAKTGGDEVHAGSMVRGGEMKAVVTATGPTTLFGRSPPVTARRKPSALRAAMLGIGNTLVALTLVLMVTVMILALYRQDPPLETVLFVLVLSAASIPLALPAVLSMTLSAGALRLARMKAVVARMAAIEDLAGLDVLCADQSGTLSEPRLVMGEPVLLQASGRGELLRTAALACPAEGANPVDLAILAGQPALTSADGYCLFLQPLTEEAGEGGCLRAEVERPLESGAVARFSVIKGEPLAVAQATGLEPALVRRISEATDDLAERGFRAVGIARAEEGGEVEHWRYLGLIALVEPSREDSPGSLDGARAMGLRVLMITPERAAIAGRVARGMGLGDRVVRARRMVDGLGEDGGAECGADRDDDLEDAHVIAETHPEHRLRLVRALQHAGHRVGITGATGEDAAALEHAEVGFAVKGASDAARQAADVVLGASGLAIITRAVSESRRILGRMSGYAAYRIAETLRLPVFVALAYLMLGSFPISLAMIALLSILASLPALFVAGDTAPPPPRPVRWDMLKVVRVSGVLGVSGVASSFLLLWLLDHRLDLPAAQEQTILFLKLLIGGNMTIALTRRDGWVWRRPFPAHRLLVAIILTQGLGTLAAVGGVFMAPIGWPMAGAVWAFALVCFAFDNLALVATERLHRDGLPGMGAGFSKLLGGI
ncbi:plasma-membrane proton-efflux P-type ATPase [Rhodospirillum rubrum]|uniref:plasma-membrane proton-efflux P-type ATPase n=1 Tax=Rhodospirillum rubrum TaxID=1085 RepID=UPI0027DDC6E2|nr:plasma-membrane proton-efflux P-type ATPase [Rhodospirillum rubrum]